MARRREKIVCQCGGELSRPIPKKCPHCGAVIAGLRRKGSLNMWPVVAVVLMFGLMIAYVCWLVGRL